MFPVRAPNGGYRLAVADPSDTAAVRAAEIVFGEPVEVAVASFEDITTFSTSASRRTAPMRTKARERSTPAIRRRHREPARSCQRRAGGARVQRSARARGRTARQRHSHRAVPHRPHRAHAGRRPVARDAGAARRAAAGADLAHQNSRRAQHRRAAVAAGRRGAAARRPLRNRRARRHHADAARRERGDAPVAARPRLARNGQARPVAPRRSGS